jgi:hypothetical protein
MFYDTMLPAVFFNLLRYSYINLSFTFGLPVVKKFFQIAVASLKIQVFLKIIQIF